jgi:hypothetical protein
MSLQLEVHICFLFIFSIMKLREANMQSKERLSFQLIHIEQDKTPNQTIE